MSKQESLAFQISRNFIKFVLSDSKSIELGEGGEIGNARVVARLPEETRTQDPAQFTGRKQNLRQLAGLESDIPRCVIVSTEASFFAT